MSPQTGDDNSTLCQPADVFALADPSRPPAQDEDDLLAKALSDGPLLRKHLARKLNLVHPSLIRAGDLVTGSRIVLSSLTPTDCLVALDRADLGDKAAAMAALALYAKRAGKTPQAFAEAVIEKFIETLSLAILQARLLAGGMKDDRAVSKGDIAGLIRAALAGTDHMPVDMTIRLKEPIIAIGAPAGSYVPQAGKRLATRTLVPEAAGAAAAVGAAIAGLAIHTTATICPTVSQRYSVHSELGRYEFDALDEAKAFLDGHLREILADRTCEFGMANMSIDLRFTDHTAELIGAEGIEIAWLECRVVAEATGVDVWQDRAPTETGTPCAG